MSYALENNDVEKFIEGIKMTFKGHPMITASRTINENGKETFVFTMHEMGSITFLQDENSVFQMDKVEGEDKSLVCIGMNLWVKKYTGKDWPTATEA